MSDHEVSKPAQAHDDDAVAAAPVEGAAEAQNDAAEPDVAAPHDVTAAEQDGAVEPEAEPAQGEPAPSDAETEPSKSAVSESAVSAPVVSDAEPVVSDAEPAVSDAEPQPESASLESPSEVSPPEFAPEPEPEPEPDPAAVAQSAQESLAEALLAAESAGQPLFLTRSEPEAGAESEAATSAAADGAAPAEDPDLAAFAEAEAAYPGTFGGTFTPPPPPSEAAADAETVVIGAATTHLDTDSDAPTQILTPAAATVAAPTVIAPAVVVQEPADAVPLPIFVQAPEPPRKRGNRGAIFGIGLLAALGFAVLYLGTALAIAAIDGTVTTDNIGTYTLDQLRSAGLWLPVALFAIGFWLLGAVINRGRWGFWVIFGIIVGVFAYGGHLLGAIGSVQFWTLGSAQLADLVNGQLLAPLAIAAFVFGRELTIWFGAWAARTGARRTVQNDEAQREYERVLEAGPQLPQ